MKILVANLGSTSLKYRLFDFSGGKEELLTRGGYEPSFEEDAEERAVRVREQHLRRLRLALDGDPVAGAPGLLRRRSLPRPGGG